MVFFTCNHCGESLKKPAVEKHYQWKSCRGAVPFLTCVDCLKDFRADEFKGHTKCITEEEKYSAKGFVAKPSKNKGALKQESWTEALQNLINKPGLDPQIKRSIERIAGQSNVPRKQQKFINFIKNSLKVSVDNAQKLWTIVAEALDEFKKTTEADNIKKREAEKMNNENGKASTLKALGESISDVGGEKKKKKKKKNLPTNDVEDEQGVNGHAKKRKLPPPTEENDSQDSPLKKKKKKNQNKAQETTASDVAQVTNGNSVNIPDKDNHCNGNLLADGGYNWQSEILKTLSKKKSEMTIDKLRDKVVKKYLAHSSSEASAKINKKFLKKLKRLPNVNITGEYVRLVE